jgi:predicted nucleic acid-binding Zn ribbon protein
VLARESAAGLLPGDRSSRIYQRAYSPRMGMQFHFSCVCGYTTDAGEGGGFVASSELRECRDCREIVGVITDIHDHPARGLAEDMEAELWRALNRCPKCDGTRHLPVRRVGLPFRTGVRCPRCGARLRERMTHLTD